MSKPCIVITERADLDLDEIGDHIAEQSGEARAETLLRKIDEKSANKLQCPYLVSTVMTCE